MTDAAATAVPPRAQERRARAWTAYSDRLRDLEGDEYERAEAAAWERLQRRLAELEPEKGASSRPVG